MNLYGQGSDTLTFAKGRSITSLYGSLTNQDIDLKNNTVNNSGYNLGTKSGYFIKNNWSLGANLALSRSEFNNANINNQSENLLLGLWSRLYFSEKGSTALFVEITPYFSSIYTESLAIDNSGVIITHEEVSAYGYGVEPGFGLVYILNKHVGFGMTISYTIANLKADISNQITNTSTSDFFFVNELRFSFNFQIYLNQFFF